MITTSDITKRLTTKQLEVIKENHKLDPIISISHGSVRSGKTREKILLFLEHVFKFRGQRKKFIITGTTIGTLKRNVLDEITECFNIDTQLNQRNEFHLFGNIVCCFGTKDIDDYKAIKGFTSHGWYGNEIIESHKTSVDQCFKRCSGKGTRIFWETNPAAPNHYIKKDYIDKSGSLLKNGQLWLNAYHYKLEDNTFLTEEIIENLKKSTPTGVWYDRDINGLWVAAEGMIYKDFDMNKHKITSCPQNIVNYIAGVDWGWEHKGVIVVIAVDNQGNFSLIDEYVAEHKDVDEYWVGIAQKIQDKYRGIVFFCDTARPEYIEKFKKKGIRVYEETTQKSVMPGITLLATLFKKNQFFYLENRCPYFLEEIFLYRMNEKSSKEEPIKENDDVMDAVRYAIYSYCYYKNKNRQGLTSGSLLF